MTAHTILLVQPEGSPKSRTYYDFNSIADALDACVELYQRALRAMNPNVTTFEFNVDDLLRYFDEIFDISALVFNNKAQMYEAKGRQWIKDNVLSRLQRQQSQNMNQMNQGNRNQGKRGGRKP